MTTAPLQRILPCILLGLTLAACGHKGDDPTYTLEPAPFDLSPLSAMASYGDFDPAEIFTNDLSVMLYFTELSCSTCTDRELRRMVDWHQRWGDQIDFVLAVQGQDPLYLRNLRRLGKVSWPILLPEQGDLDLPKTAVVVVSKQQGLALARWHPLPDADDAEVIAAKIEDVITQNLAAGG